MQTIVTSYTESYVDTHPYYRSTFIPARTIIRTATGSGVGAEVTGVSGSNQLRFGTHTDYSFPYLTGGAYYVGALIKQKTASGSGLGTETATSFATKAKLGTGLGTGTESASGVRIVLRTATGSGIGADSAVTSGSNQLRLTGLTDYSFPYLTGGRYYLGPAVYARTATGSGLGTETATKLLIVIRTATGSGTAGESTSTIKEILARTATGSGTGSGDADPFLFLIRLATGSGTGTSSAAFIRGLVRSATGSGLGTGTATAIELLPRTATGSGTGTQAATRIVVALRTATGSGVGTETASGIESLPRTATGSGVGAVSQDATWVKSHMFRVPQTTNFAFVEAYSEISWQPRKRLFARLPNGVRVENLFELQNGSYTINDPRDGTVVKVYLGSHVIPLTDEEVTDLTAAGYGAYIT